MPGQNRVHFRKCSPVVTVVCVANCDHTSRNDSLPLQACRHGNNVKLDGSSLPKRIIKLGEGIIRTLPALCGYTTPTNLSQHFNFHSVVLSGARLARAPIKSSALPCVLREPQCMTELKPATPTTTTANLINNNISDNNENSNVSDSRTWSSQVGIRPRGRR